MNKISVVICVKNGESTIKNTLDSLILNNPYELIIIDGESTDKTLEIAKKYTDKIYSDKGNGLAFARQIGAEKASGYYVAYIDSDAELPKNNILDNMAHEMEENQWVAIHTQLIDPRPKKTYWEEGENFHWNNRFNTAGKKSHLGTIVCLIKKDIILKQKFDISFKGAAEDADFYARLLKKGYKFGVSSEIAYHYHRSSFEDFYKQRIWYGKGNAKAIKKHRAINLFFSPIGIGIYGVLISIYNKKPRIIPFYIIWMVFLTYGTFLGFIELNINP